MNQQPLPQSTAQPAAADELPAKGSATACDLHTPVVLQCPPSEGERTSLFVEVLDMGWPFAILMIVGLTLIFDRKGRIGLIFEAIARLIHRANKVVVGGTEITAAMEAALDEKPAIGVAPVGNVPKKVMSSDDELVKKLVEKDFSGVTVGDYPYLMHEGKKTPKGRFPFAARVYLEFWTTNNKKFQKKDVEKVFYRVDDTFPDEWWVMTSDDPSKDFQLVVRIIGEFTIVAVVKLKSGELIWLTRYLDLPGRPVD